MERITLFKGDITKVNCDAIVNAANSSLMGGGGVDGAIHRTGGKEILEDCMKIRDKQGGCKAGEAVITRAGKLQASKIIHTVGPVWNDGNNNEKELLENCYRNVLNLANEFDLKRIAIPNISTGVYKFPKSLAAQIAIDEVKRILLKYTNIEIIFVCYDEENFKIYKKYLASPF